MKNPAQVRRRQKKTTTKSSVSNVSKQDQNSSAQIQDGARNSNEGGKMESGPLSLRLG